MWVQRETVAAKTNAHALLEQALRHDRLITKVGDSETMRFDLAAARLDLAEFKRRCDAMLERKP